MSFPITTLGKRPTVHQMNIPPRPALAVEHGWNWASHPRSAIPLATRYIANARAAAFLRIFEDPGRPHTNRTTSKVFGPCYLQTNCVKTAHAKHERVRGQNAIPLDRLSGRVESR